MKLSRRSFTEILQSSEPVRAAFNVSKQMRQNVYLVGGTVRDIMMKSELGNDYDFVVEGNVPDFAAAFAEKVGGSFFVLDEERHTSRVVSKKGFQADFSALRGPLEEDLKLRDFTINSMAIPVESVFEGSLLVVDPLKGLKDIEDKILRESSPGSLEEDALRIMRGFRFASALGFSMDRNLIKHIREWSHLLDSVSKERVRTELFMILHMQGAYKVLRDMDDLGVLHILFPEMKEWKGFYQGGWHAYDLFDHSMKSVEAVDEILDRPGMYFPGYGAEIDEHMREEVEAYVTRRGLLKLASLLHDSGKFHTRVMEGERGRFFGHEKVGEEISVKISRRFKLGRRSEMMVRGLTGKHMRVFALSKLERVTKRAKLRFFRDADGFGQDLLILSLADAMATPVEGESLEEMKELIRRLLDYYFEEFVSVQPGPLLTGDDIMKIFMLPEGKKVGAMLEALREAEAMGEVSNKGEAIEFLKKRFLP